ncbi:MAG: helix-turn-helix transcriptional regulator [Halobacteriaceae archaeon]
MVIVVLGLLLWTPALPAGIGTAAVDSPAATDLGVLRQQSFDADSVVMAVDLHPDGSADWTVRYRLDISTENETAAFEELRADIRNNTSAYIDSFRSRIAATAAEAENATGRSMAVATFSIQTRTDALSESAFITYTFTWTGFATVQGQTIRAGDAISGLFLDAETTLTMTWPESLTLQSVDPAPTRTEADAVSWEGRQTFALDEPRVVVGPATTGFTNTLPVVLGVGLGLLLLVAAGLWLRRSGERGSGAEPDSPTARSSEPPSGSEEAATGSDSPPPELLSNEEQVVQFLEEQGGRAKQQDVVAALDWTEAKTSQVVTDMREAGDLEVFRIGRENVLKLPDAEMPGDEDETDSE